MLRAQFFAAVLASASVMTALPAFAQDHRGRTLTGMELAGRQVQCDGVRLRLDGQLDNLGAAVVDHRLLLLNPTLLRRQSKTVQLFVFHHECGHHRVGGNEMKADCWAVNRGFRDGWLDRSSLAQVCRSFGDAPETPTHPSGRRRCANLDRCFVSAEAAVTNERKALQRHIETVALRAPPKLVAGPRLVRQSMLR